ncbi:MAG: hypothetical protein LC745_03430 [Planctomycetia bacterium]|nr:hypothetical protein [Planctomycetia bacterium]
MRLDKHTSRPRVEVLEGKALLSGTHAALPFHAPAAIHESATPQVGVLHESFHETRNGLRFGQSVLAPTGVVLSQEYTVTIHWKTQTRPAGTPNFAAVVSSFSRELNSQITGHGTSAANNGFVFVNGSDTGLIRHESFHVGSHSGNLDLIDTAPSGYIYQEHYTLAAHRVSPGTPGSTFTAAADAAAEFTQALTGRVAGTVV